MASKNKNTNKNVVVVSDKQGRVKIINFVGYTNEEADILIKHLKDGNTIVFTGDGNTKTKKSG